MAEIGPGKTRFLANADGSLSVRRWNDPSWQTYLASAHELTGTAATATITRLLAEAYKMGMEDKATIIRQALS